MFHKELRNSYHAPHGTSVLLGSRLGSQRWGHYCFFHLAGAQEIWAVGVKVWTSGFDEDCRTFREGSINVKWDVIHGEYHIGTRKPEQPWKGKL